MPNLVTLTCPILQILDKTQTGVFSISRFLAKFLKTKTVVTPELVKKYGNVTKNDGDAVSKNYDVIIIFPIYGQFGVIPMPDSGHMAYNF